MLLTPDKGSRLHQRERIGLAFGMLALCLLLLWTLSRKTKSTTNSKPHQITCNAETIQGDQFLQGGLRFGGAEYRTQAQSRSGKQSIVLPADGNTHYGFSIVLDQLEAGRVYEVSIWSRNNDNKSAKLAVQGRKPGGFYMESAETLETDKNGWARHYLRFHIPFRNSPTKLSIYVYSNGSEAVYFDDLTIDEAELWDAASFQARRLELNFDQQAAKKLSDKREEALREGLLQTQEDDWVDAQLIEDSLTLSTKIRLKGDWLDHLRENKWSFRVKVKNDQTWNGLITFSLHNPATRYFLHEWLLHEFWKEQGVLTTRYDFVELVINGESRGIYAYEEHFEKQLPESQQRREGPIVKFNEDGFWEGNSRQFKHHGFVRPGSGHRSKEPANAIIDAFNQESLQQDSTLAPSLEAAHSLLEQYRQGNQPVEAVFDLDKLARFYAGCDLMNAYHGIIWHNQRFYYNPVTTKLEPIGFDGFSGGPSRRYHFLAEGSLRREAPESTSLPAYFLRDTAFIEAYISVIEEVSRPNYWQDFIKSREAAWFARLQWMQIEFPYYKPDLETMSGEVAFVRSHILPFEANCLKSYQQTDGSYLLENTHTLPIIVKGYSSSANYMAQALSSPLWLSAGPVRMLHEKLNSQDGAVAFRELDFWNDQALAFQDVPKRYELKLPASAKFLYVQVPGWDTTIVTALHTLAPPELNAVAGQGFQNGSQRSHFPSLHWNEEEKTVTIPSGVHSVKRDLIIPKGYLLKILAGAEIVLNSSAALICHGAVRSLGEESKPVFIRSQDGTGQGLVVLQSPVGSILRYTIFQNLGSLNKRSWQLTGAVTFYESAVQLEACRFLDSRSEDALNIIRSAFEMNYCLIQNAASDGFDADFCKGTISHSRFINTINDGVDFSGSIITLKEVAMESCGDKGISAGEASDITVRNATISNCEIGLASKDKSTLYVRGLQLDGCRQGMVVFQKKPEFGPAFLLVEGLEVENTDRLYQIGPGSRLQINDDIIIQ